MLDDTCYMLGFDQLEYTVYSLLLLNSKTTREFLQSITFSDTKRIFTKDVLMRIALLELAKTIDKSDLQNELNYLNKAYDVNLRSDLWSYFIHEMKPVQSMQMQLFA